MKLKIIQYSAATLGRLEPELLVEERWAWMTGWNSVKGGIWEDLRARGYLHGFGDPRIEGFRLAVAPDTGEMKEEQVLTFFLRRMTLKTAKRLADKHELTGFVYKGPETGGAITLQGPNGALDSAPSFHPLIIAYYFACIVDAPFYFYNLRPRSWFEGFLRQVIKKRWAAESEEGS